jgi:hypothetical protein
MRSGVSVRLSGEPVVRRCRAGGRRVRKLDPSANRRFAAERRSERIAFSSNASEQMASRAWEA